MLKLLLWIGLALGTCSQGAHSTEVFSPAMPESSLEFGVEAKDFDSQEQVLAVSQLTDVQPQDWAFQALQSLVDRYGCLQGGPEAQFRGEQPLNRYEFAAGLEACLARMTERLAVPVAAGAISQADWQTVQRLQADFAAELTALQGRVSGLEARADRLATQQFSTTTVLSGQAILALATATGGGPPGLGEANPVLTNLVQLQLTSSFTGRDLLRTVLSAGNFAEEGFANPRSLNTYMALLSYQSDQGNQVQLSSLDYRLAVGDRLVLTFQPVGFSLSSVLSPNSSYLDAGQGAISRFAAVNPVFRLGNLDTGIGLDWLISDQWRLQLAYGARNGSEPGIGFFNSGHQAFGLQFLHKPNSNLILGLALVNAASRDGQLDTFTGSANADTGGGSGQPASITALSVSLRWRLAPKITLGAWAGAMISDSTFGLIWRELVSSPDRIDLEEFGAISLTTTYLLSLGIDDPFGRRGDQFGLLLGQPPRLAAGVLVERLDTGTSLHLESYYRLRLNDRLSLTPGFFYITNPGHLRENNNIFVGTLRATFNF